MIDRRLFYVVYALSGAAALVYEVTWTRLLTLHMGHTVAAVSTVLAAFMGGLATGAAFGGGIVTDRPPVRALRIYAGLEVAIAVYALVLPLALAATEPLLGASYHDGQGGSWFGLTRVLSSFVLVGIPAAAIGATFPVATRWVVERVDRAGRDAGGLYAANTIGGAIGAAAAAFVLIPSLGLRATTLVGVTFNLLAAGAAFWFAARASRSPALAESDAVVSASAAASERRTAQRGVAPATRPTPSRPSRRQDVRAHPAVEGRPWLAATALGVSGFVALAYEVTWTRILAMIIGPTSYAFGMLLATFIAGLAIGAVIGARLTARVRQPVFWLALMLVITAAGGICVVSIVGRLPLVIARMVTGPGVRFESIIRFEGALVAGLLLPMTAALGAAFPLAVRVAARRADAVAIDVAIIYTLNTIGAIAGALIAGFALIPLLGLQSTVLAASGVGLAGAVFVIIAGDVSGRARLAGLACAGLAAFIGFALPPWDKELISSGAYKYAPSSEAADLEAALEAGTLLYYEEGMAGTVSVRRETGVLSLAIDGKVDASNAGDLLAQKLLAHLPLLLHRNPKDVCIIGLGSGVTLGAALRHRVTTVDMLENSPEVVEGSTYFATENHSGLDDPRTRLVLGDGRSHLLLSSRKYDVIISAPSNPWMAGVAPLYTQQFFAAARDRLAAGGVICQWAHTHDISEADLKSVIATFGSVFPHSTLWLAGGSDLLLIGSAEPLESRVPSIADSFTRPGVSLDLAEVAVADPFSLLSLFVGGEDVIKRYGSGAVIQTDDRVALEFSAPRSIYGAEREDLGLALYATAGRSGRPAWLDRALQTATAAEWRNRGRMELRAEAYAMAYDAFARALALDAADEPALAGLTHAAIGSRKANEALALLRTITGQNPQNIAAQIELSRLLVSSGNREAAMQVARRAAETHPDDPRAAAQLAAIFAESGDIEHLRPVVQDMRREWAVRWTTLYYAASLEYLEGRFSEAVSLAARATTANPSDARAHRILGAAYARLGQRDPARRAFEASTRADPRDPAAYVSLGLLNLAGGDPAAAVDEFAQALALDRTSAAARKGLADALERLGETKRARRVTRGTG